MADEQDKSQKTEEPTEKKLLDARRKGDVPQSRETGSLFVVMSLFAIVAVTLPLQLPSIVGSLSSMVFHSSQVAVGVGKDGLTDLGDITWTFTLSVATAIAPVFGALALAGLIGALLQGPTVVAWDRVKPKASKISVREGIKRLFSVRNLVEFIKNLLKVLVIGALAIWATNQAVRGIWEGLGFYPEYLPGYIADYAGILLVATVAVLIPIAIADNLWRRYEWRQRQMMTNKEVRDEYKEAEGSPEMRAKRAAVRRERSRQRVAAAVPLANLVLTNPTHFSVALKYDPAVDVAPICVAKGADNIARIIREIAFEHEIPVIENKPLARGLYDTVEVDQIVPVDQWEVVAEIVRFVMDMSENRRAVLPEGSALRGREDE